MDFIKSSQKQVDQAMRLLSGARRHQSYRRLVINFLILTVNLVIIILYFALAQATIILTPAEEDWKHQLAIPLIEESPPLQEPVPSEEREGVRGGLQTSPDAAATVTGKISETTINLEQTFAATGAKGVEAPAVGEVTVYNTTTNRPQPLVATTQFVNEAGQIVRIKDSIAVSPGQTITVAAYADKAGKVGEVEPGRFQILKLKGARDQIYGVVKERFTGGVKSVKIVSADDLTRARAEMEQKLKLLAQEKLSASQDKINPDDITLNITRYDTNVKADDTADSFTVKAKAEAKMFVFDKDTAKEIIKADLENNLPPDKTLIAVDETSFTAAPDASGQVLNAEISAGLLSQLPAEALNNKKALTGLNRGEVKAYFAKVAGVKKVAVHFWPFWVRSVPKSESHIKIEVIKY